MAVNPDGIPDFLKERPQWVVWKLETRKGKLTKVPYNPWSFERASTTDLMTWEEFDRALAAYKAADFDGIGFVFCSADPFVGIDFDACRNSATGLIGPKVSAYLDRLNDEAYVELSPSGTGLHVIMRGTCKRGQRRGKIEMYGQDRYFTITGVSPNA